MNPRAACSRGLLALVAAWALVACAPVAVRSAAADLPRPPSEPRLAVAGSFATTVAEGSLRSSFGCEVRYEVHLPADWDGGVTVVLAHGFLRDLRTMRGWAAHLSSHGVATAVVSLCNSTPFAGRHDRNAIDLRALADLLQPADGAVLYAGFSAGGLAALLAAADDPRTVAYLGLDAVDSGGLASRSTGLAAPALFLLAEAGACNAEATWCPSPRRSRPPGSCASRTPPTATSRTPTPPCANGSAAGSNRARRRTPSGPPSARWPRHGSWTIPTGLERGP
jgi:hypothetical protein